MAKTSWEKFVIQGKTNKILIKIFRLLPLSIDVNLYNIFIVQDGDNQRTHCFHDYMYVMPILLRRDYILNSIIITYIYI